MTLMIPITCVLGYYVDIHATQSKTFTVELLGKKETTFNYLVVNIPVGSEIDTIISLRKKKTLSVTSQEWGPSPMAPPTVLPDTSSESPCFHSVWYTQAFPLVGVVLRNVSPGAE